MPFTEARQQYATTDGVDPFAGERFVWAAAKGDIEAVIRLHAVERAGLGQRGRYSRTALIEAAHYGHGAVVKYLLCMRADVNEVDECGRTPLMHAASEGRLAVCKMLLAVPEIDVKARDVAEGQTAIMMAAKAGHDEVVKLMLERDRLEYTHTELLSEGVCEAVGKVLEEKASAVVHQVCFGFCAISSTSVMKDDPTIARLLIQGGADVNGVLEATAAFTVVRSPIVESSSVPVILAAAMGHGELLRALLECGADVDRVGLTPEGVLPSGVEEISSTCTAVSIAIQLGRVECVKVLLAAGASLDIRRLRRLPGSLLIDAVKSGQAELVELLVGAGLKDIQCDMGGLKARDHANLLGRDEGWCVCGVVHGSV
ncbi:hypothetical protein FOZ61_009305 [Perkinsus olseni]|uniref:Ankyrin Repeat Protein n=1 Tax=Perkinsus olseni TaxID=32597 RepID=A0A7J6M567_PEROL|nr:hypothetical protein FOZ61_009305 [Perkinsus olseni]